MKPTTPSAKEKLYYIVLRNTERALHRIGGNPVFKSIEPYKRDLRIMDAEEAALVAANCTFFLDVNVEFKEYQQPLN